MTDERILLKETIRGVGWRWSMRWNNETASSKVEGLGKGLRVREKNRVERVRKGREVKRMVAFNMVEETLEVVWKKTE